MAKDQTHTSQKQHLELNVERRRNDSRMLDGLGIWALSIPHQHSANLAWPTCRCEQCLYRKYPDLKSECRDTQNKAWIKFIKSGESIPYRVRDKI